MSKTHLMAAEEKCIRKHARRVATSAVRDQAELRAQQVGQNLQARNVALHQRRVLVVVVLVAIRIGIQMHLRVDAFHGRKRNF